MKRRAATLLLCLAAVCSLLRAAVIAKHDAAHHAIPSTELPAPELDKQIVELELSYQYAGQTHGGAIRIALFNRQFPRTVDNFLQFCRGVELPTPQGKQLFSYVDTPIHRIVDGFVIQGGDVLMKNGYGAISAVNNGANYFENEPDQLKKQGLVDSSYVERLHDSEGTVAMANSGPDTNGSQFYITLGPQTPEQRRSFAHLDGQHPVFGKVVSGMAVVHQLVEHNRQQQRNQQPPLRPTITRATVTDELATERMLPPSVTRGPPKQPTATDSPSNAESFQVEL